jgi:hypothetical protein
MAMSKRSKIGWTVSAVLGVLIVGITLVPRYMGPSAPLPAVDVLTRLERERAALETNAEEHYLAAMESMTPGFDPDWAELCPSAGAVPAAAREWLAANDAVFEHMREAGRITDCRFAMPLTPAQLAAPRPASLSKVRELAKAATLRALVAEESGDRETFVESVRMIDVLARHVWQTPTLIEQMVGTAIEALAQRLVLRPMTWDTLSAEEKSRYGTQIGGTLEPPPDLSATLQNEIEMMLVEIQTAPRRRAMQILCPDRRVFGELQTRMAPALDLATAPLEVRADPNSALRRTYEATADKDPGFLNIPGMLARIVSGSFGHAIEITARLETEQRGNRCVVELFHHFNRHGAFPKRLVDLEGAAEAEWLTDPFGQAPFLYERTGDSFRLWSRGLDGDDDDGVHEPRFGQGNEPVDGDFLFWPLTGR